jgi:transposase
VDPALSAATLRALGMDSTRAPATPVSTTAIPAANGRAPTRYVCFSRSSEAKALAMELPRFGGNLSASGRKPGEVRFQVPRTRPPYPEEFRREAIRLAQLGDKPQRQLAEDLGISDVTLRNWIKQEKAERGERPGNLSQDEREELNRLRDENAKLRMEREILAKAAAFFAKESDGR